MFDTEIFNLLKDVDLNYGLEYQNLEFVNVSRSSENVHDDYTPLWIKADIGTHAYTKPFLEGIRGTHEPIIDVVLKNGYVIDNVNNDIRNSKFYTYHVYKPVEFYNNINTKEISDEMYSGHKSFYDIFDNSKYIWMYNTENIEEFDCKFDCFVGVGAGVNPWITISNNDFSENSIITFIDINKNSKIFNEWFIQQPISVYKQSWSDIFQLSPVSHIHTIGDPASTNKIWEDNKNTFIEKIEKIKNFTFNYLTEDIISSDNLSAILSQSNKPLVWFSNVFSYFETFEKNYQDFHLEYFLHRILTANPNAEWFGSCPSTALTVTSPNVRNKKKISEIFYKKVDIPLFDTTLFMNEIKDLENNNLFVKHRKQYYSGWDSITLHGTAYNNTETSNQELNHWTTEALTHCPSIVEFIKNSGLKDTYNRVRIMKLHPNSAINIHSDDMFSKNELWGLNISINNPADCIMHFWSNTFDYLGQVPWEDQLCFKIKISNKHMVINNSETARYHIIVHGSGGTANDTY
jgi:hypothetical protein